jgi:ferric iron reductase protein FhuF
MVKKYPWTKDYATDEYLTLLNTYSDHYTLEDEIKKPLFQEIGALIDRQYGGCITKPHLSVLFIARKSAR